MFRIQPEGVVTFFLLFLLIKLFFLKEKFGYDFLADELSSLYLESLSMVRK